MHKTRFLDILYNKENFSLPYNSREDSSMPFKRRENGMREIEEGVVSK